MPHLNINHGTEDSTSVIWKHHQQLVNQNQGQLRVNNKISELNLYLTEPLTDLNTLADSVCNCRQTCRDRTAITDDYWTTESGTSVIEVTMFIRNTRKVKGSVPIE